MKSAKRVAVVYDWIDKWGGVERVLLTLHELFPEAVFYTSYVDYEAAPWARALTIKTTFLQRLPAFIRKNRLLSLPFFPMAFESLNLSAYDVVISVSSSFAKGVITKPDTRHVCYLLTPSRYFWVQPESYISNPMLKILVSPFVERMRAWDFIAAQRPDIVFSISSIVAQRSMKFYKRKSKVVYPPFHTQYWEDLPAEPIPLASLDYYLVVARLESYKKVDIAIKACEKQGKNVIIVGTGSQKQKLQSLYKKALFLENIPDTQLKYLYTHAHVLLMPQEEDFGYVAAEAIACGCPVLSYQKSGAAEIIEEEKTGTLVSEQSVEAFSEAIARSHMMSYNVKQQYESSDIRRRGRDAFMAAIKKEVSKTV